LKYPPCPAVLAVRLDEKSVPEDILGAWKIRM